MAVHSEFQILPFSYQLNSKISQALHLIRINNLTTEKVHRAFYYSSEAHDLISSWCTFITTKEGGWMAGALCRKLHFCCQVAAYSALSRYLALNKCLIRAKSVLLLQLMVFVDASGEQEYDCNFMLKNSQLTRMLAALQLSQRHSILPSKVSWCRHTWAPHSPG